MSSLAAVDQLSAGRTRIAAIEYETLEVAAADLLVDGELRLYPQVLGKGYFKVRFDGTKLKLQAGGFTGLIPLNDRVALDVRSRVPVQNLARLIRTANHVPVPLEDLLRSYDVEAEVIPSLVDTLANALMSAVDTIRANGRHYEYVSELSSTSFPRGRILMGSTVQRFASRGVTHKVEAVQYRRTPDTAVNRCIKYALWFLAQRYVRMRPRSGVTRLVSGLNHAYHLFDDVLLDHSLRFLDDSVVLEPDKLPLNYAHYRQAIGLAVMIIEERSVELEGVGDDVELSSLLVELDDVFEDYVRIVLQRELAPLEPQFSVVDGNLAGNGGGQKCLFDDGGAPPANPDIVAVDTGANLDYRFPLLGEVKYKPAKDLPDRDDLNQLIAYATSYRCPVAVIVQPRGNVAPPKEKLRLLGKIGNSSFYQYVYDLSADSLMEEERIFAEAMARLMRLNDPEEA